MTQQKWLLYEFHPIVKTLVFGTVLINIARSMIMPFLAIYLANHTALGPAMIGSIIGAGAVAGTVGGWIGGTLSDFIGRRKVVIGSLLVIGLVFAGYAVATSTWVYFLLSIIGGLGSSFLGPVVKALIGDLTAAEKRIRAFSLQYMATNVGYVVGPLLGSVLGITSGRYAFIVAGSVYVLYASLLQLLLVLFGIQEIEAQHVNERITIQGAWQVVRADQALLFLLIGGTLSLTVHGQMSVTLGQYVDQSFTGGKLLFTLLIVVNAVLVILLQVPISKWFAKKSPFFNIVLGSLLLALGEVGFACSRTWVLMILSMVVLTIGEIFILPAEYQLVDNITPHGMRGTYYGAQNFMTFGNFLGPWVGGIILAKYGGQVMFLVYGLIAFASILFYGLGKQKHRQAARGNEIAL